MSAECNRCGSDIVYPAGTWPVGECPRRAATLKIEQLADIALAARVLFGNGLDDAARSVIFDPHGAVEELQALADALRKAGFE